MNRDLDAQLEELGPEYRELVTRLVSAYRVEEQDASARRPSVRLLRWWTVSLLAASLLVIAGFGLLFRGGGSPRVYTVRASDAAFERLRAEASNDVRLREFLRTNVADKGCSPQRRFGIIAPIECTSLTTPSADENKITEGN